MGLFDKKYCDICGDKIGLLGNKKLDDGNMCKDCAKKLSPWFSDRRKSSVQSIKDQLAYREENKNAVAAFNTTRAIGRTTKVLLDEDAGVFMVTSARNLSEENPDVLKFSQVTGCDLDVNEQKSEETREVKDSQGNTSRVSYNPPRYTYSYDFNMIIRVNTPYFDEIRFRLNSSSIVVRPMNMGMGSNMGGGMRPIGRNQGMNAAIQGLANAINQFGTAAPQNTDPRMQNPDYAECWNMGQEIKEALTQIRTQVRENVAAANAPKVAVTCPYCGASTIPDPRGCCEFCGGAIGG